MGGLGGKVSYEGQVGGLGGRVRLEGQVRELDRKVKWEGQTTKLVIILVGILWVLRSGQGNVVIEVACMDVNPIITYVG